MVLRSVQLPTHNASAIQADSPGPLLVAHPTHPTVFGPTVDVFVGAGVGATEARGATASDALGVGVVADVVLDGEGSPPGPIASMSALAEPLSAFAVREQTKIVSGSARRAYTSHRDPTVVISTSNPQGEADRATTVAGSAPL